MTQLELEASVIKMLLAEENKSFQALREQYKCSGVKSREFTGRGFFTTFDVDMVAENPLLNGKIDDVKAIFPVMSEECYFILYITNGKIDTLEGFSTLNEWSCDYRDAKILYCFSGKRSYNLRSHGDG